MPPPPKKKPKKKKPNKQTSKNKTCNRLKKCMVSKSIILFRFVYPPHQRFYGKQWNSLEKIWTRNRLKCLRMHHLHPFFEKFLGEVPGYLFDTGWGTPPHRSDVGLQPPPAVDLVSGSVSDNAMYIFDAILLKIQLSLSEFKRLYLHSRLHHFASFFQNFLEGGPPNPHQQEGTPLPYPPHSALRASRTPPPQVELWIRHWPVSGTRTLLLILTKLSVSSAGLPVGSCQISGGPRASPLC